MLFLVSVVEKYDYLRLRLRGYSAIGRPYETISVPPEDVEYMISKSKFGGDIPRFDIVGGDWDKRAYLFEQNAVFEMFKQHFIDDVSWKHTETYQKRVEQLNRGESVPELDTATQSVEVYESYLSHWDSVYEEIKTNGYRSQRELRALNDFAHRVPTALGEIEVMIGREGQLICNSGKHRLTTAKLLELDSVPVRVTVRHESWQELRERVAKKESGACIADEAHIDPSHPDLVAVQNK